MSDNEIWACEEEFLIKYLNDINGASEDQISAAAKLSVREPSDILSFDGDNSATIEISGVLSRNGPSRLARFFGYQGASYNDIIESANVLAGMDEIENVRILADTPGGSVSGADETYLAISNLAKSKNVVVENRGIVASAGYWIASAADSIIATSPVSFTGSIGVAITQVVDKGENDTSKKVTIVSRNAKNKNLDASTEDGVALLQARADAVERVFLSRVAEGRGISVNTVIKKFGKGDILIAHDPDDDIPDALSVGMIDAVSPDGVDFSLKEETKIMANERVETTEVLTFEQILEKYPNVKAEYAACLTESYNSGVASASKEAAKMQSRYKMAVKYLQSDEYPKAIKNVAYRVLAGEVSEDVLLGASIAFEAATEMAAIDNAVLDTDEAGSTHTPPEGKKDNTVVTCADIDSAVANLKRGHM